MAIHSRFTPVLAVIGVLALGGASTARAQDTSAAARADTSGYRGYEGQTDTTVSDSGQRARTDTSGFEYTGPPTDTALKAKPGAQTGRAAGDTGNAALNAADTAAMVVCKDGSNEAKATNACKAHGGIDWAATRAALKARGDMVREPADSTAAPTDTTQPSDTGAAGYQDTGAPSDTALKTKPGTQTGPDTGSSSR
jgi:hypothetical protein